MAFQNKHPLPIEDRIRYAESHGYKGGSVVPVENMQPDIGRQYLDFQRAAAEFDMATASGMPLPADKVREYEARLEGLLGLMTDTSVSHQARFLGFRTARSHINDGQLAAMLYSYFHLAQQMIDSKAYTPSADPLMNFIDGFRLGHDEGKRKSAADRCDTVLAKAVPPDKIRSYKSVVFRESGTDMSRMTPRGIFPAQPQI